jgi:hypothetical protein
MKALRQNNRSHYRAGYCGGNVFYLYVHGFQFESIYIVPTVLIISSGYALSVQVVSGVDTIEFSYLFTCEIIAPSHSAPFSLYS